MIAMPNSHFVLHKEPLKQHQEKLNIHQLFSCNNYHLGTINGPVGRYGSTSLTHSFPTAKQLFPDFFTFFYATLKFLRPEHDFYAKFTSCFT